MEKIIIENIVTVIQLKSNLNIEQLSNDIEDSKYDPNEFPGLVVNYKNPKIVAIVFSSGKILSTGAKNLNESENIINKTINKIQETENKIFLKSDINIQNIVGSYDLSKKLDLSLISKNLMFENIEYLPEHFLGLIYKNNNLGTTIILFESGKIVCTGAKNFDDLYSSISLFKEKLTAINVL